MTVESTNNGATTSSTSTSYKESVSEEVKAEYDELIEEIQTILAQSSYSDSDAETLEENLNRLYELQNEGLDYRMSEDLSLIFSFFKLIGYEPPTSTSIDPAKLSMLQVASISTSDPDMTISYALEQALDADRHANATNVINDILLDTAVSVYDSYTEELEDLQEQLDASTDSLDYLSDVQDVFNAVTVDYPDDYSCPPESWDEIPAELQEKIKADSTYGKSGFDSNGEPKDFDAIKEAIYDKPDAYIDWSEAYFKEEIGYSYAIEADTLPNLLNARDNLIDQLAVLEEAGADTSDGSAYATIKAVVDAIEEDFPESTYPPGTDWDQMFTPVYDDDGNFTGEYTAHPTYEEIDIDTGISNSETMSSDALASLQNFIKRGQDTEDSIIDLLDDALQACQTLSSSMSDELKAQNYALQQIFTILTEVLKIVSKAYSTHAQSIGR